jgi:hypothetical protein
MPACFPGTPAMFCISLHILPEHSRQFDQAELLRRVRDIRSPEVDAYEEKKQFHLAFHFFTEYPAQLWSQLKPALLDDSTYSSLLKPVSIICCEGETEEDYWLLHHHDQHQKLDKLP